MKSNPDLARWIGRTLIVLAPTLLVTIAAFAADPAPAVQVDPFSDRTEYGSRGPEDDGVAEPMSLDTTGGAPLATWEEPFAEPFGPNRAHCERYSGTWLCFGPGDKWTRNCYPTLCDAVAAGANGCIRPRSACEPQ